MKYLICTTYARAKGISREALITQVEATGALYNDTNFCDDYYNIIRHPVAEDKRAIICLPLDNYEAQGLASVHVARLVDAVAVNLEGWEEVVEETIPEE